MKTIETERLILRTWQLSDADDMFMYAKDIRVGPEAGWKPHDSVDESLEIIEKFIKNEEVWAIEYKEDNKVIGGIGLHKGRSIGNVNDKEIGYVLSPHYWGRGIMVEAAKAVIEYGFSVDNLDRITCGHYPENNKSKRVIEKIGFNYEGTIRKCNKIYDGTKRDFVMYSILSSEYKDLKNKWESEEL